VTEAFGKGYSPYPLPAARGGLLDPTQKAHTHPSPAKLDEEGCDISIQLYVFDHLPDAAGADACAETAAYALVFIDNVFVCPVF